MKSISQASVLLVASAIAKKKMFEAPVTLETKKSEDFDLSTYYLNLADT